MLPEDFIYIVIVIQLLAASTYMWDTVKGKARPNRVSWFLWGIFAIIGYFASVDSGAGKEALFTLMVGVNPLIIFGLSFVNKEAYWKIQTRDYWLGALAVASIILWLLTGEGLLALVLVIIADFLAGLPTLIKAFSDPDSESGILFGVCIFNSLLALATVQDGYTLAIVGFPFYVTLFCATMFYAVVLRPRVKARKADS